MFFELFYILFKKSFKSSFFSRLLFFTLYYITIQKLVIMENPKFELGETVKGTWALDIYDYVQMANTIYKVKAITMDTKYVVLDRIIGVGENKGNLYLAVMPQLLKHVTLIKQ